MKGTEKRSKFNLNEFYSQELAMLPMSLLLGMLIYLGMWASADIPFSFKEMFWYAVISALVTTIGVIAYLWRVLRRATGIKKTAARITGQQTDVYPIASAKAFLGNASVRKVNGRTEFFSGQRSIFNRSEGRKTAHHRLVEPQTQTPFRRSVQADPLHPEVIDAIRSEVINPLQFMSRANVSVGSKGLQISGRVMVLFLTIAFKNNKYGKGLSKSFWTNTSRVRRYREWWMPHYYIHVMDIIKYAEETTGITIVFYQANNWKLLNLGPKSVFAILSIAHFPNLYEGMWERPVEEDSLDSIISKVLKPWRTKNVN